MVGFFRSKEGVRQCLEGGAMGETRGLWGKRQVSSNVPGVIL